MKIRLKLSASRAQDDPEKSITPVVFFANASHKYFSEFNMKGFVFGIGWWDFSIKFFFIYWQ